MKSTVHQLHREESIRDGMARVITLLVADAFHVIAHPGPDRDEDLHQVRLVIKRLRSYLRLMRPVLGETAYFRQNRRLRDAARRLSALRDTTVAQGILESRARRASRGLERRALQGVLQTLARQLTHAHPLGSGREGVMRRVGAELQSIGHELASLALEGEGWEAIRPGLEGAYRRARRAMRRAVKSHEDADYHDWRKHAKDLFFHFQLLEPAWPGPMRRMARRLDRLQNRIGQDHDLHVVRELLRTDPVFHKDPALARVRKEMGAESRALRKRIQAQGRKLYDDPPGRFVKSVGKHWKKWRGKEDAAARVFP